MKARSMPLVLLLFAMSHSPAQAYIGPGLAAGTIALIVGFVSSIGLAMFAVCWYPIKRFIQVLRGRSAKLTEGQ